MIHRMRIAATLIGLSWIYAASASQLEATVVDGNGKPLPEAVVYLAPKQPVTVVASRTFTVDQVDKEFVPRVSVVQTGTSIRFPNRDNIRHQVYSFSPAKTFSLKLYSGTPSDPVTLDKTGVVVLGCNIHDHMIGWIFAVDTPWFSQADASGHASVAALPAGQYEMLAWHPGIAKPVSLGAVQFDGTNHISRKVTLQVGALMGSMPEISPTHDHAGS